MLTKKETDIYKLIAEGKLPHKQKLVELLAEDPARLTQALQAKAFIDIATVQDEIGYAEDKEEIQRLNLRLTHARWQAERLLPDMYGNKQQIEVTEKVKISETEMQTILDSALESVKLKQLNKSEVE